MAKRFIVSPSKSGGTWNIEEEGMGGDIQTAQTREEAVMKGEEMAREARGTLVIQNEAGDFEETKDFFDEGM